LPRRGFNADYNTIPKSWEWLIVNCAVNAARGVLPSFYIFKGERLKDDYIRFCKLGTCMAMQKRVWMIAFLFKEFLSFFNKSVSSVVFLNN
jgi:hypothetical protein